MSLSQMCPIFLHRAVISHSSAKEPDTAARQLGCTGAVRAVISIETICAGGANTDAEVEDFDDPSLMLHEAMMDSNVYVIRVVHGEIIHQWHDSEFLLSQVR